MRKYFSPKISINGTQFGDSGITFIYGISSQVDHFHYLQLQTTDPPLIRPAFVSVDTCFWKQSSKN